MNSHAPWVTRREIDASPIEERGKPAIVAMDMGYGHLRPARALARELGQPVLHADCLPLADPEEQRAWRRIRLAYETVSRVSTNRWTGEPFRLALATATAIPHLYPFRDLSEKTFPVRLLEARARAGLGRTMVAYLQDRNAALLTTFYSPALFADFHGYDKIYCVVTDADINRVWAPFEPSRSKIHYFAPSGRVVRRLRSYGVSKDQIELTGYPLPHALVGGTERLALKQRLLARLARLDEKKVFRRQFIEELEALGGLPEAVRPPHLVFAVGGAGAQAELPAQFLPSLRPLLLEGRLSLTLVAGKKPEVKAKFEKEIERARLGNQLGDAVSVLYEPDVEDYLDRFDQLLAECDILWTKPSELTFYGALGIPLVLAPPIGVHEKYNRRWLRENGAGLKQRNPEVAAEWLKDWLRDGTLAAAAWAGHKRLPSLGLYRILERLGYAVGNSSG
jgi:UDP-N-acetylglucosamine:LPS N-acetylglucosamine transferase